MSYSIPTLLVCLCVYATCIRLALAAPRAGCSSLKDQKESDCPYGTTKDTYCNNVICKQGPDGPCRDDAECGDGMHCGCGMCRGCFTPRDAGAAEYGKCSEYDGVGCSSNDIWWSTN